MRGAGGRVRVRTFPNEFAEAHWVTAQIADALAAGTPPGEILALARTGYATEPLQRALAHAGIPHRVLGSLGLYERTEVRDALAYLTLIAEPARRAGVPPRDRLATPRDRRRDRHQAGRMGARAAPRRPDRRQRPRRTSSTASAPRPRACGWSSSAPRSSRSAASSTPDGRSATS